MPGDAVQPDLAAFRARIQAVPLERVLWQPAARVGVELWLRRDDALDAQLSGNKYYKLVHNLCAARRQGYRRLASFGGPWSNHLHALAHAGRRWQFETHGLIRGERPRQLSATLQDLQNLGMHLHFVSRMDYADSGASGLAQRRLTADFGPCYWIPEGGNNALGALGTCEIGRALERQLAGDYQAVCVAVGTGCTLAGIAAGLPPDKLALGFSVLKGAGPLGADIQRSLAAIAAPDHPANNWRLISGYHAGGYGRRLPPVLASFWQAFEQDTGIALDPVYTLKLVWGVCQLVEQGYWARGSRLVLVHTGGLQGRRGFQGQLPEALRLPSEALLAEC